MSFSDPPAGGGISAPAYIPKISENGQGTTERRDSFLSRELADLGCPFSNPGNDSVAFPEGEEFYRSSFLGSTLLRDEAAETSESADSSAFERRKDVFAIEDENSDSGSDVECDAPAQLTLRVGPSSFSYSSSSSFSSSSSGSGPAVSRRTRETSSEACQRRSESPHREAARGTSREREGTLSEKGDRVSEGGRHLGDRDEGGKRKSWSWREGGDSDTAEDASFFSGKERQSFESPCSHDGGGERLRQGDSREGESPDQSGKNRRSVAAREDKNDGGHPKEGDKEDQLVCSSTPQRHRRSGAHSDASFASCSFSASREDPPIVCTLLAVEHPVRGPDVLLFHLHASKDGEERPVCGQNARANPLQNVATQNGLRTSLRCADGDREGNTLSSSVQSDAEVRHQLWPSASPPPRECRPTSPLSAADIECIRKWTPLFALPDFTSSEDDVRANEAFSTSPSLRLPESVHPVAESGPQTGGENVAERSDEREAGSVFFLLSGRDRFFFGLSCYKQIDAAAVLPSASRGSRVRCAVCVISSVPFWGSLLVRFSPVAEAFFQSMQASSSLSSSLASAALSPALCVSSDREARRSGSRVRRENGFLEGTAKESEAVEWSEEEVHADAKQSLWKESHGRNDKGKTKREEETKGAEQLLLDWTAQINAIRYNHLGYSELFFDLEGSLTPFVLLFPPESLLQLAKALLLEKKILFFSRSPTRASSAVLAFLSLFPAALNCGYNSDGFANFHYRWRMHAFPFHFFHPRCILVPFLSLPLVEELLLQKRGFLVGASNWAVRVHPVLRPDVFVDLDRVDVHVEQEGLLPCLELSPFERLFATKLVPEALACLSRRHPKLSSLSSSFSSSLSSSSLSSSSLSSSSLGCQPCGGDGESNKEASHAPCSLSPPDSSVSSSLPSSSPLPSSSLPSSSSFSSFTRQAGNFFQAVGTLASSSASSRKPLFRKQKSGSGSRLPSCNPCLSSPLPPSASPLPSPPLSLSPSSAVFSPSSPSSSPAQGVGGTDPIAWLLDDAHLPEEGDSLHKGGDDARRKEEKEEEDSSAVACFPRATDASHSTTRCDFAPPPRPDAGERQEKETGRRSVGALSHFSRAVKSFASGLEFSVSQKNSLASSSLVANHLPKEKASFVPSAESPSSADPFSFSSLPGRASLSVLGPGAFPRFSWKRSFFSFSSVFPSATGELEDRERFLLAGNANWEASVDLVRAAFTQYLEKLCRSVAIAAGPSRSVQVLLSALPRPERGEAQVKREDKSERKEERNEKKEEPREVAEERDDVEEFNGAWIRAWTETHNFQVWLRQHRLPTVRSEEVQGEEMFSVAPQEGYGRLVYANGDVYEGEFSNSVRHGQGIYSGADGLRYEGDWQRDRRHGCGVLTHDKVNFVYVGQWEDDKKSGDGHLYSSTERYWGGFAENKYSGKGTYVERTGGIYYEGEFADGVFHGLGKLVLPLSSRAISQRIPSQTTPLRSTFPQRSSASPSSSFCPFPSFSPFPPFSSFSSSPSVSSSSSSPSSFPASRVEEGRGGSTFCGEWRKGKAKGVFTCVYEDGCMYTGLLSDALLPHGTGTMMFPDGSSFEGEWRDGQRHGAGVFSALIADSISSADADVPSLLSRELAAASSPRSGETGVDTPQRPGAEKRVLVVEGEWHRDSPAAEKEWTLTFPSGDKYAGLLHLPSRQNGDAVGCEAETMAPSENGENASQRSKQVPTGEERHTRRRDHSQSTPYEKGEEEKGEEEKEKKERKREMNLETELRRFVLPHGPGFAKLKATGETYEGQWKLGTRNGEGESIASTGVRYRGEWVDGVPHGQGVLTHTESGEVRKGGFHSGFFCGDERKETEADHEPVLFSAFLQYPLHRCRFFWSSTH
ncbi:MORN repeat-containing protein [Toxoplasma gondii CAST]|uniref:MORN repeat-containing protein n=1 Tax=Toxoplasma gondii CAST TaxID=943122 RepID=A0A425HNN8_TOXGO|nr:MORN repeat-containing protein [Toxoplasma gondii CAST]